MAFYVCLGLTREVNIWYRTLFFSRVFYISVKSNYKMIDINNKLRLMLQCITIDFYHVLCFVLIAHLLTTYRVMSSVKL